MPSIRSLVGFVVAFSVLGTGARKLQFSYIRTEWMQGIGDLFYGLAILCLGLIFWIHARIIVEWSIALNKGLFNWRRASSPFEFRWTQAGGAIFMAFGIIALFIALTRGGFITPNRGCA